jgi:hypothetical protein
MDQFTEGQLTELCQMVVRGCKPCAIMPIKTKDLNFAKFLCKREKCLSHSSELNDDWHTLWIFKREELFKVINLLRENPVTEADHYLLGALFGYSNDAICDYIANL